MMKTSDLPTLRLTYFASTSCIVSSFILFQIFGGVVGTAIAFS